MLSKMNASSVTAQENKKGLDKADVVEYNINTRKGTGDGCFPNYELKEINRTKLVAEAVISFCL